MSKWTIKRRTELTYQRAIAKLLEDCYFISITALSSSNLVDKTNDYVESKAFDEFGDTVASMIINNLFGAIDKS